MAEVYRARDELLGREVAVKVLNERLSGDRSFVERFKREAQAAAGLSHPNIVSLYDYGNDNSTYFIVMEFIDGRSLGEIIEAAIRQTTLRDPASRWAAILPYLVESERILVTDPEPAAPGGRRRARCWTRSSTALRGCAHRKVRGAT